MFENSLKNSLLNASICKLAAPPPSPFGKFNEHVNFYRSLIQIKLLKFQLHQDSTNKNTHSA